MHPPLPRTRFAAILGRSPLVQLASALGLMAVTTLTAQTPPKDPARVRPPHGPLIVAPGVELARLPESAIKGGAMTSLPDGRLMLVYAGKDVFEPVGTSSLRAVYSRDGGRTWGDARECFQDSRFNPGRPTLLRARDGRLWLVVYGFQQRQDKEGNGRSDLWVTSSTDHGATWAPVHRLYEGYTAGQRAAIETRDGRIVIVFSHAAGKEERNVSASLVSADAGRTWRRSNTLELPGKGSHSGALEPTVIELKDGRLWMLIRHPGEFYGSYSHDGGLTWTPPVATGISNPEPAGGAPASLIRLADGRLAMAWNPAVEVPPDATPWQRIGRTQLAVAVSTNEGRTWSPPAVIARTTFLCYPHLIETAPGQLVLSTGLLKADGFKTDVVVFHFAASAVFK